jgi:hypothetical protein
MARMSFGMERSEGGTYFEKPPVSVILTFPFLKYAKVVESEVLRG